MKFSRSEICMFCWLKTYTHRHRQNDKTHSTLWQLECRLAYAPFTVGIRALRSPFVFCVDQQSSCARVWQCQDNEESVATKLLLWAEHSQSRRITKSERVVWLVLVPRFQRRKNKMAEEHEDESWREIEKWFVGCVLCASVPVSFYCTLNRFNWNVSYDNYFKYFFQELPASRNSTPISNRSR